MAKRSANTRRKTKEPDIEVLKEQNRGVGNKALRKAYSFDEED